MQGFRALSGTVLSVIVAAAVSAPLSAQDMASRQRYDLEAADLADTLNLLAQRSGAEVIFPADAVKGQRAPAVHGNFTLREVLELILERTGLAAEIRPDGIVVRQRTEARKGMAEHAAGSEILVTGSRIRGAPVAAPVIRLSQEQIRDQGRSDLGEVIRTIPQNFSGGQNPGVTFATGGSNQNLTSGSAMNLRGLGADATLTLLNGHRMAYDAANQAIDISSIPLAAVDRLEVVADGSSALYGSDAVAGVVNVILKRDFDGLDTRARFGAATSGGFVQQQYSVVTGARWNGGGLMVAGDHNHSTQISARQRSLTAQVPDETTLYPRQNYAGVIAAFHQDWGSSLQLEADAYYSRRTSSTRSVYSAAGFMAYGSDFSSKLQSFGVAPRLLVELGRSWRGELAGTFAQDRSNLNTEYYLSNAPDAQYPTAYTNRVWVGEISAEGPLFVLPGGESKLAVGGGVRSVGLTGSLRTIRATGERTTTASFDTSRDSYFAYTELYLPVWSDPSMPGLRRLSFSGAARYEYYPDFGSVLTPKLGAMYSPIEDIDVKGTWGRSFKAPTLYQTSKAPTTVLTRASDYASGYPSTATVLYTDGGNPDLKPERAQTWTASVVWHPRLIAGSRFEIGYFDVRYRNRILMPIGSSSGVLTSPIYTSLVTANPSIAQMDQVIANSPLPLRNSTGQPFNYADVIAIVDNRFRNFTTFSASGIDFAAHVPVDLGASGTIGLDVSGAYQRSSQQASKAAPEVQRAGTIFYPPKWRARASGTWSYGGLTLTPSVDYIGGLTDTRTAARARIGSMTTFDLTLRLRLDGSNVSAGSKGRDVEGTEIGLTAQNIFNAMPERIDVPAFYYPPYDSANYSIMGRFVAVSLSRRW